MTRTEQLQKKLKTVESKLEKNIVYKISDTDEITSLNNELKVNDLVGVIIDGSTIGKIKFEKNCTVLFSNRRFRKSTFLGLCSYVPPFVKYFLGRREVVLDDVR